MHLQVHVNSEAYRYIELITVLKQHMVNKIPIAQLAGDDA